MKGLSTATSGDGFTHVALYSEEVASGGELPANIMDSDPCEPGPQQALISDGGLNSKPLLSDMDPLEQTLQAVVDQQMSNNPTTSVRES